MSSESRVEYHVNVTFSIAVHEDDARRCDPTDLENGAQWFALDLIKSDPDNVFAEFAKRFNKQRAHSAMAALLRHRFEAIREGAPVDREDLLSSLVDLLTDLRHAFTDEEFSEALMIAERHWSAEVQQEVER